jgi:cytochrome c551/c552
MVLVALAVLVLIQLVPVTRDNPPDRRGPGASPEVTALLRRACYDCHSHETVWPWYSGIAPVSWLVAHDVHEGREKLNLSTLQDISAETQVKVRAKALQEVEEGEMPMWYYLPMHPQAKLSEQDKAVLKTWR